LKKVKSFFSGTALDAGAPVCASMGFLNSGSLAVVMADSMTLGIKYAIPIDQAVHTAANANANPQPKTAPSMSFFSISLPYGRVRKGSAPLHGGNIEF
jgi:hypothetical protein